MTLVTTQAVIEPLHKTVITSAFTGASPDLGSSVEQVLGVAGNSPGDPHPLPHSTRELSRYFSRVSGPRFHSRRHSPTTLTQ